MQKNYMNLKRKVYLDGKLLLDLSESSILKDTEGTVEVPTFGRKIPIKDGVSRFDDLTLTFSVKRDSEIINIFNNWKTKNEYHDVKVENTDATGTVFDSWLMNDCECNSLEYPAYNAAGVEYFRVTAIINCTTEPVRLV